MKCPFCGYTESKVIDSRPAEGYTMIRRRRECLSCQKRFTTYESIERMPLVVVKRDGLRQSFDRVKLINGMVRACEKRPVPLEKLEAIADEIEQELQGKLDREISTVEIGEMVMKRLKEVDEVAYVRFASVYRSFKDINTFMEELRRPEGETGCRDHHGGRKNDASALGPARRTCPQGRTQPFRGEIFPDRGIHRCARGSDPPPHDGGEAARGDRPEAGALLLAG